jgi:hypothetical protein
MEQIFDFQFSKEVYIRPSTVQANKGGEVTDFVIQVRYTTCIVPKGCFAVTRFSHVRRKSLNLLKFHISANNYNWYTLNHTQNWMLSFYKFSYFTSRM